MSANYSHLKINRPSGVVASKQLVVGMGDMVVSNDPTAQLVTYSLGSCVGVAIYDPLAKVGGLLHAMLPDSELNLERAGMRPFMFVDTGVIAMFHAAYAFGAMKSRMIVKVCGGATFLDDQKNFRIGERNVVATMEIFKRNSITVASADVGGAKSRTVRLNLGNGEFTLDTLGENARLL